MAGAVVAALPDIDVVGFRFGVAYESVLGHRGLTHSLAFAALIGVLAIAVAFPKGRWPDDRGRLWSYLATAAASHGVLDAMTTGGFGVAFFAPFDDARYFFSWRPIAVSPLGLRRFFTRQGLAVLANEALWVGLPAALLALAGTWRRRRAVATAIVLLLLAPRAHASAQGAQAPEASVRLDVDNNLLALRGAGPPPDYDYTHGTRLSVVRPVGSRARARPGPRAPRRAQGRRPRARPRAVGGVDRDALRSGARHAELGTRLG